MITAFVDESGDEGTAGAGSRWLCFGAVIVADTDVRTLNALVISASKVVGRGKARDLHMHKIRNHADKKGILSILGGLTQWTGIVVASDTCKLLPGSWLKTPKYQYNYAARHIVERISWYAKEVGEPVEVVFDTRRNFSIPEFQKYMRLLRSREDPRFAWDYFDPINIRGSKFTVEPCLCISDALAHAAAKAIEPDAYWRSTEVGYLRILRKRIWKVGTPDVFETGFVLMPRSAELAFKTEYPWIPSLGV